MIPHSRPAADSREAEAVANVLRSGYQAQGKVVEEFEKALARFVGCRWAVATSSGTAALHLALLGLGVGEGDAVILPSYVCAAVLNAVNYTGAEPELVDVAGDGFHIDPLRVRERLSPETKAIIAPHLFGKAAALPELLGLGVPLIEDCAQSLGAAQGGKKLGSRGEAAIFSFYATKLISTGQGGMLLTDSEEIFRKAMDLREHDERDDYRLRYNYRMTDIQAALGLVQLAKLPGFISRRAAIAGTYREALGSGAPGLPPEEGEENIFYRFPIRVEAGVGECIEKLRALGIEAKRPVFRPLHRYLGCPGEEFSETEKTYRETISLPIYPGLSEEEVGIVAGATGKILGRKCS